ncbi:hypothetical protein, partial [Planomonospora algeriensis]
MTVQVLLAVLAGAGAGAGLLLLVSGLRRPEAGQEHQGTEDTPGPWGPAAPGGRRVRLGAPDRRT